MRILTVVGARPQFVKAAAVSRVLRKSHSEFLVHTGQHYDAGMSDIFFEELGIPAPDAHLGIGSGSHGAQTGAMLASLESVMEREKPDWVLVYGDTNSTLAAALAAAKLHLPVAHVEAGVRSFNWRMPEEINRVLTDAAADLLLAPTQTALAHLSREGVHGRIVWVGDVMLDLLDAAIPALEANTAVRDRLGLAPKGYYAATLHRPENADDPTHLASILEAFAALDLPVVLPVHPRTRKRIAEFGLERFVTPRFIEPVGYFDMLALVRQSKAVLTDSGGLQKEAAFLGVPCVTMREQTEWPETVEHGWNRLCGADKDRILAGVAEAAAGRGQEGLRTLFGAGKAAARIVEALATGHVLVEALHG